MNKDIIYIDVEDDITTIIGKVKDSAEKIVALVPPKRIGVLQSAVNLRLLQRTATQQNKRIVIITGNQALSGLAAAASIPVARNLQSKPEIAEIAALEIDDGEDIIDGSQLPVGDHAKQDTDPAVLADKKEADLIKGVDVDRDSSAATLVAGAKKNRSKSKKSKVPNFNNFRKRLVIIIIAAVLLIGGLVWAFVFAPSATIVITARTTEASVNDIATFGKETNAEQGIIQVANQELEDEVEIEFDATGEKDVGEKATGSVRMVSDSFSALMRGISIPAGTTLTSSSGKTYSTDRDVNLSVSNGNSDTVPVTATENGSSFNGATGPVSGAPSSVDARFTDATSGGTSKTVPIVTAGDVQKARQALVDQSTDDKEKELVGKFPDSASVITESFRADYKDVSSEPAVGAEVGSDAKAKLTGKVVYTLSAIQEEQAVKYLEETMKQQMQDQTTQKIYDTGVDELKISEYSRNDDSQSVRLSATGQIGPEIDTDDIKSRVAGKRYGDIQSDLSRIDGVNEVDVKFSFFWVRTVPENPDKIKVEFDVNNAGE